MQQMIEHDCACQDETKFNNKCNETMQQYTSDSTLDFGSKGEESF